MIAQTTPHRWNISMNYNNENSSLEFEDFKDISTNTTVPNYNGMLQLVDNNWPSLATTTTNMLSDISERKLASLAVAVVSSVTNNSPLQSLEQQCISQQLNYQQRLAAVPLNTSTNTGSINNNNNNSNSNNNNSNNNNINNNNNSNNNYNNHSQHQNTSLSRHLSSSSDSSSTGHDFFNGRSLNSCAENYLHHHHHHQNNNNSNNNHHQNIPRKKLKQSTPGEQKDDKYWQRRQKNNMAAKRSRDMKRSKEVQLAERAAELDKVNMELRRQDVELRRQIMELQRTNSELISQLSKYQKEKNY